MMYEEDFIRVHMGNERNANSILGVTFNAQVIQPVHQMFPVPGNSDSIDGNQMIIHLNEQCVERNAQLLNGDWKVGHTLRVEEHKQFLREWTFCIEAVKRNQGWQGRKGCLWLW